MNRYGELLGDPWWVFYRRTSPTPSREHVGRCCRTRYVYNRGPTILSVLVWSRRYAW